MSEFDFLEEQGVNGALIKAAEDFRREFGVSDEAKHRLIKPALPFYGKETSSGKEGSCTSFQKSAVCCSRKSSSSAKREAVFAICTTACGLISSRIGRTRSRSLFRV